MAQKIPYLYKLSAVSHLVLEINSQSVFPKSFFKYWILYHNSTSFAVLLIQSFLPFPSSSLVKAKTRMYITQRPFPCHLPLTILYGPIGSDLIFIRNIFLEFWGTYFNCLWSRFPKLSLSSQSAISCFCKF